MKTDGDSVDVVVVERSDHDSSKVESRDIQLFLDEVAHDGHSTIRRQLDTPSGPIPCIATRLAVDSEPVGSVCLFEKKSSTRFGAHDEHLLELFGAQAALAIGYARQLQRAYDMQRKIADLHEELSAAIAHNMRTPVSAILLQLDALVECNDRDDAQALVPVDALTRMRDAGRRLARMIDDLFDVARIELGQFSLERQKLSLRERVQELIDQLGPMLSAHPIRMRASSTITPVFADALRLDEVLTNLIENAAKYSPPGSEITVRIEPSEGGAIVSVEDQGIGIAEEDIPKVFDRFFQSRRSRTKHSGLGLGLYITKAIVDAHDGRIWVDSVSGKGSRFHVWLPTDAH